MSIISYDLEALLTSARGGYDFQNHSLGSHLVFIAFHQKLLADCFNKKQTLSKKDLRSLGILIEYIKDVDFKQSLHSGIDMLLALETQGKSRLLQLDSPKYKRFDKEYDFLKYLTNRKQLGLNKLSYEAQKNINLIEKFPENNTILNSANENLEMYFLEGEEIDFNGYIMLRKKTNESLITKLMLEFKNLYSASKEELEKVGFYNPKRKLQTCQKEYRDVNYCLLCEATAKGEDVYTFFGNWFESTIGEKIKPMGMNLLSLYFVDYVGAKICSDKNTILNLDKHLNNELGKIMRIFPYRTKNYLKEGIKDQSIVYALNGSIERAYIETRFQPILVNYEAEFGEFAHFDYKHKSKKELADFLLLNDEMVEPFVQLCYALDTHPKNILKEHYLTLSNREKLIEYNFE